MFLKRSGVAVNEVRSPRIVCGLNGKLKNVKIIIIIINNN